MTASTVKPPRRSASNRSPEHQLILASARCWPDVDLINEILDAASASMNWQELIQFSSMHGVLPLVYRCFTEFVPRQIPRPVLSEMMEPYLLHCDRNRRSTAAAQSLVDALDAHGTPLIVFKGPVLAESIYGNINFRQFSDVDLLIHEEDVSAVRQQLMGLGFKSSLLSKGHDATVYLGSRIWDDSFYHEEKRVTIDLHWQLMPDYFPVAFDSEKIWSQRQLLTLRQTKLYSLGPEDMLLYLCAHGCKELWRRLIWVCDIAEFVRVYPDLPWQNLLVRSRSLGIERMFLLGLLLAHDLLETPIPPELADPIQQPIVRELAEAFKGRIFQSVDGTIESAEHGFWLFHNPLHLKLRERWRDRLPQYWLTLKFLITPNQEDSDFLRLPQILEPTYYFIRPLRLGMKWGLARLGAGR